jgi:drug/metabolite transporter (DMT)-like permease
MRGKPIDRVTLIAFAIAVVVLGANWVGVRFSNRELPPFWGAALRFSAASLILFGIVGARGIALPRGRALIGALVYGVLQFGANFGLLYWALVTVPAGMTSVLFATMPLMALFVSSAAGFDRVRPISVIGGSIALIGLSVIFAGELTATVGPASLAAILGGALAAAFVLVVLKAFPRTHPFASNAIGTATGALILLGASFVLGEPHALPQAALTWGAVGYLVASTIVGFSLLTFVVLRWTPAATSYAAVLSPVVTLVLATAIGGEVFGPLFFVGAAVVGVGVYLGAIAPST